MGGLAIGLAIGFAAAGGIVGYGATILAGIMNLSRNDGQILRGTLAGAFMGAAIGGGAGWLIEGGPAHMMESHKEQAVVDECVKRIDSGENVVLGLNAQGGRACIPAPR